MVHHDDCQNNNSTSTKPICKHVARTAELCTQIYEYGWRLLSSALAVQVLPSTGKLRQCCTAASPASALAAVAAPWRLRPRPPWRHSPSPLRLTGAWQRPWLWLPPPSAGVLQVLHLLPPDLGRKRQCYTAAPPTLALAAKRHPPYTQRRRRRHSPSGSALLALGGGLGLDLLRAALALLVLPQ